MPMILHLIQNLLRSRSLIKLNGTDNVLDAIKNADLLVIHTEWNEYRGLDLLKVKKELKIQLF